MIVRVKAVISFSLIPSICLIVNVKRVCDAMRVKAALRG